MSFQDYRDWGGKGGVSTRQRWVRSAPKSPDVVEGRIILRRLCCQHNKTPPKDASRQAGGSLKVTPFPPACSWGDALRWAARRALCIHSAGSACSPVLPIRGILSLGSELGWKELQLVCRQLGYLRVCIIWAVCDCRVPLFYLIVCLEASSDLIMPVVVSLGLSCVLSGITRAGPAVHMLAHNWANTDWQWVSGFLRLRSLLGC